jgi:hypothetical protein
LLLYKNKGGFSIKKRPRQSQNSHLQKTIKKLLKNQAKPTAAPFIQPFKTLFLPQTNGKTCGNAVHLAIQNALFTPNQR